MVRELGFISRFETSQAAEEMTETKRNGESEKTSAYLWFDQDQIEEKDNKIMLDVFVCETLATRALCQANALSQSTVIGLTVCRVQAAYGVPALNTYGHCSERFLSWSKMVEGWELVSRVTAWGGLCVSARPKL